MLIFDARFWSMWRKITFRVATFKELFYHALIGFWKGDMRRLSHERRVWTDLREQPFEHAQLVLRLFLPRYMITCLESVVCNRYLACAWELLAQFRNERFRHLTHANHLKQIRLCKPRCISFQNRVLFSNPQSSRCPWPQFHALIHFPTHMSSSLVWSVGCRHLCKDSKLRACLLWFWTARTDTVP